MHKSKHRLLALSKTQTRNALACCLVWLCGAAMAQKPATNAEDPGNAELTFRAVGAGWHIATLPKQRIPITVYSDAIESGKVALRLEATDSYGPLVKSFYPAVGLTQVAWSWRVAKQSDAIDLRKKSGDDTAAKICMSFVWPDERMPFLERQLVRIARSRSGQDLSAATLCWAWAGSEELGVTIDNPYTRRVRSIALRNASHVGSAWFSEKRDIMKDLHQAFGDEWPSGAAEPGVTAIFISADADNTHSHSIAWIADFHYK
jgi:hypothetical protein